MLAPLLQPDLSPQYLSALAWPVAETLLLTLAAMAIAVPLGMALGLFSVLGGRTGRITARIFTIFRAVPELTLAIICVVFFGIGPAAALVAIAAYYLASTGKVFGDLFAASLTSGAVIAMKRTGVRGGIVALWALIPACRSQLLAYGGFAFECALRASVVVGAVGGGGLGAELVSTLASFDLHRASTTIIVTIALIAGLERAARWFTARPRLILPLLLAGLAYAAYLSPSLVSPSHSMGVLAEMVPPTLNGEDWSNLPRLIGETVFMALGATMLAAALALPLAFAASRISAPVWISMPIRLTAIALRAVPELIWGLIVILYFGIGPAAGLTALFLHSLGSLLRLFADALDAAPPAPRRQIARSGASALTASLYAAFPQARSAMETHMLFRFEWNLRMATVLGMIGAGGIGQALYEAQQLLFYDRMLGWLIVTIALLLVMEWLTGSLRKLLVRRHNLRGLQP